MNTSQILIFARCMQDTFRHMLGVELVMGTPKEAAQSQIRADVSATISVLMEQPVIVVLSLNEKSGIDAARRLTMQEWPFEDPMVGDTARELLNIAVGAAQRESPVKFAFSLPISVQGHNHEVSSFRRGRNVAVELTWEGGCSMELFLNLPAE